MWPVILQLGPVAITSLGLAISVGAFLSLFVIYKRSKESHLDEATILDLALKVGGVGLMGGWGSGVLLNGLVSGQWGEAVASWEPFFLGSILIMGWAIKQWGKPLKSNYFQLTDMFMTGWLLFRAINSVGELGIGARFGEPTTWFWGVRYPGMFDRRIPVQLIESLLYFGLFSWVYRLEYHYRTYRWYKGNKSEANDGFITASGLLGEGIIGLLLLSWRPDRSGWGGLSLDLVAAGVVGFLGLGVFHARSGWGLKGILAEWSREIGLTGSLIEGIKRRQQKTKPWKLGDDLLE